MSLEEAHTMSIKGDRRPRANSRGNYVEPMDVLNVMISVTVATLIFICVAGLFVEIFSTF
jgi:hypothetical protein